MIMPSQNIDEGSVDSSNEHTTLFVDEEFDSNIYYEEDKSLIRASTAPARPYTDMEEFRISEEFRLLEQSVICSQKLIQKPNSKFELESPEGQKSCKKYLKILEKLHEAYKTHPAQRNYRSEFSKAYKILYKEGQLSYLTEILDSAQEAFPYLWVNGEKYVFSPEVLESGKKLFASFTKIQNILRNSYTRACQDNTKNSSALIKFDITRALEDFDHHWVAFEKLYVFELMVIEADARRFISDAIETEKDLQSLEIREKARGKILLDFDEYHKIRGKLVNQLCQINAVANSEGKGRDDLTIEILLSAEGILRRISPDQSKAVRKLAEEIRNSFMNLRQLLRKYEQNIEIVDPQLKNNPELVELLVIYEKAWEKAKNYFLNTSKCNQLIHFSQLIEIISEKYSEFADQIECRDADIFVSIPCIIILKNLERCDKGICQYFLPNMYDENDRNGKIYLNLLTDYIKQRKEFNSSYEYYNVLEKLILGINLNTKEEYKFKLYQNNINPIIHKIKQLSIELQRNKPSEWNEFLDVALLEL